MPTSSKFLIESTGEKIVKIGQYLANICTKYDSLGFFGPPCRPKFLRQKGSSTGGGKYKLQTNHCGNSTVTSFSGNNNNLLSVVGLMPLQLTLCFNFCF